ncbi:hypothetical protein ACLKA6_001612 [Drosophila palustris]
MRLVTRKMKKARDRFRRRRQVKRQVVAAVARSARSDPRVFADFNLVGRQMRGLLDSGATVSLLGRGCRELAEELNLPVKPYVSTVRIASGEDRSIIGRLVVPVEYKGAKVADLQGAEFDPSEVLGFQTNEFQSEEYQELVREVQENKECLPDLKVEGGAIFKRIMVNRLEEELDGSTWKLWVPASLTHELVRRAHEEHTAAAKTLHALRRQYFWPKMAVQVAEADRQRLIQEKIQKHLHAAYERSSLRYNERARELHLTAGQEVFRRNFSLSNFSKAYNAKFARKFVKARVVRSVGSNMYELEDEQGRPVGVFHSKDIRQLWAAE